ncbi:MAG TPA: formyltetrahydrofolate deformylase [Kiritimatiellia bacterium]|jgi:formyltetrahydrofolate deformylase
MNPTAILLISCPDRRGIVAAVTAFIRDRDGNIIHLEQHVDDTANVFFMRVEWSLDGFQVPRDGIASAFEPLQSEFGMAFEIHFSDVAPRMAVFVSKEPHCFHDILARWNAGEWHVELPLVVSNHDDLKPVAERFGVPFHKFQVQPSTKPVQEVAELRLLREERIDFVVLARYMQILGARFVEAFPHRIINIHHSFLPAFPGAKPYHSAHERGVKVIGATSHYVTEQLDEGPIIEQDIIRVSHRDSVDDMVRKGRDLEKVVLARAILAHIEHRVLVHGNKTVVFE